MDRPSAVWKADRVFLSFLILFLYFFYQAALPWNPASFHPGFLTWQEWREQKVWAGLFKNMMQGGTTKKFGTF